MARMAAQGGNGLVGASRNLPTGMQSESSRRALADAIRRCINEDEDSTKKYGLDYNRAGPAERAHYPWTEGTGTLFKPLKFEQFMSSNEIDTIELLGPADSNNFSPQEGENVTFVKQYFQLLFFHDPNMGMNTMNRYLPAKLRGGSHDSGFKQVQDKVFKAKGEVLSKCKRFGRMLAFHLAQHPEVVSGNWSVATEQDRMTTIPAFLNSCPMLTPWFYERVLGKILDLD